MAFANTHQAGSRLPHFVVAPFKVIGGFLVSLTKASAHAKAVDRLNALSDADLAAMNTTRQAEVEKMFRIYMNA